MKADEYLEIAAKLSEIMATLEDLEEDLEDEMAAASVPDHQPLTDAEMEAELDQAEADEAGIDKQ